MDKRKSVDISKGQNIDGQEKISGYEHRSECIDGEDKISGYQQRSEY